MDVLRLFCIVCMVIRHTIQSMERLYRVPVVDLSFFLHGLPLFVYVAGRGFGTSLSTKEVALGPDASMKARFLEHVAFVKRRALQLLIPSFIGTALIVVPTEYVGRNWRHCAKGPDAPLAWLQVYLLQSNGAAGVRCEGLGWLGFMVSLFIMQAMLRPWAMALHRRISASCEHPLGMDLGWVALWISGGVFLSSFGLPGDAPMGLRGFLRPDTALAFAPTIADVLSVSLAFPWRKSKGELQASLPPTTAASLWLPSLVRRMVASIALATCMKKTPYDDLVNGDNYNHSCLWIELLLLMVFYQQGIVDGIFRGLPPAKEVPETFTAPLWNRFRQRLALAEKSFEKSKSDRPRLTHCIRSAVAWGLWLLVSLVPVSSGFHIVTGPGFRYPAYYRSSAGSFVLRSWLVLGIAVWWFGSHLPPVLARFKNLAQFGFTLYMLHWFFIELALDVIYRHPRLPAPGELPWWFALVISCTFCLLSVAMCHGALKVASGRDLTWKWSINELVIRIKT